MSTSAWWMLALTWSVILFFCGRFLARVLRADAAAPDADDEQGSARE